MKKRFYMEKGDVDSDELMAAMQELSNSINNLIAMFKTASENIISEPDSTKVLSQKLDKLVAQNEEIAKSLVLLLELEKEHLPLITNNTRQASEIRLPQQRHFSMRKPMPIRAMKEMPVRPMRAALSSRIQQRFGPPPEMQGPLSPPPEKTLPPDLEMDLPDFESRQQKRRLFG